MKIVRMTADKRKLSEQLRLLKEQEIDELLKSLSLKVLGEDESDMEEKILILLSESTLRVRKALGRAVKIERGAR